MEIVSVADYFIFSRECPYSLCSRLYIKRFETQVISRATLAGAQPRGLAIGRHCRLSAALHRAQLCQSLELSQVKSVHAVGGQELRWEKKQQGDERRFGGAGICISRRERSFGGCTVEQVTRKAWSLLPRWPLISIVRLRQGGVLRRREQRITSSSSVEVEAAGLYTMKSGRLAAVLLSCTCHYMIPSPMIR